MTANMKSCTVSLPKQCNHATFAKIDATLHATQMQPESKISLKAIADTAFKRNHERNQCATTEENLCNFLPQNDPEKLHELHGLAGEKVAQLHELHATFAEEVAPPEERPLRDNKRPSPVALSWLHEHRQRAKAAGWTMRELYRRNKSPGICWCSLWDKPFFKAFLHDDGVIEFEFIDGGRDVIQTARPMPQRTRSKQK